MFYVDKNTSEGSQDSIFTRLIPAVLVFIFFFGLTVWTSMSANRQANENQYRAVALQIDRGKANIANGLSAYEGILRAGAGYYASTSAINKNSWKQFVSGIGIDTRYPGLLGLGVTRVVDPAHLQEHSAEMLAQGQESYKFRQTETTQQLITTSIDYLEPLSKANQSALGYDMFSEPVRRRAMLLAIDTGQASVTEPVTLVQEGAEETKQPGFLMYVPIYKNGTTPDTVEKRRADIIGFSYAPFRSYDFISSTHSEGSSDYGFEVRYGDKSSGEVLYQTPNFAKTNSQPGAYNLTGYLDIYNVEWIINATGSQTAMSAAERNRGINTFWSGLLLSLLMAGFIYLLLLSRGRALSQRKEQEVQAAKDELLALASHQLRTPATGVKQYIGMLRDGYAGNLSDEQLNFATKAYESNERQLRTINEMLCVARMDTGCIEVSMTPINLNAVVQSLYEDHIHQAKLKNQKLIKSVPKEVVTAIVDERYIRMALENLLSNAIKYTREGGNITLRLRSTPTTAIFEVEDNGVGVDSRDEHLLFQKFSRIPNELTNQVSGTGIGLYLAQQVATAHRGRAYYRPSKKKGSVFGLKVPLQPHRDHQ